MAMKLNPPDFGKSKSYERYKQELLAWREVTEVKKEKLGIAVALSLPDETTIRDKVFDELGIEDLKGENGFDTILEFFDKNLSKDDLTDSIEKFESFEDCKREPGQSVIDFISNFDQKYNKILKKKMKLPSEVLAFKLLRRANISREERMLVMTGMDYSKKDTLYEQTKQSLKKFKGEMASGGSNLPTMAIKCEPTFVAASYSRGRYNRGRRPNRSTWRGGMDGRKERPVNPMGSNGKPMTCLACGSYRHLVSTCPHSWENLEKVNISEEDIEEACLFTGGDQQGLVELGCEAKNCAILDSACSSTVCGRNWMSCYLESLDAVDKTKVVKNPGSKTFKFGDGKRLKSEASYSIPAFMAGHRVSITADVVDSDIPLLLSLKSMKDAKIKLDTENDKAEILGTEVSLNYTSSGHYSVSIDRNSIPVETVHSVKLSDEDRKGRSQILRKLHRQFAHPSELKFITLLKDAGMWEDVYSDEVSQIYAECDLCKAYTRTPARPAVGLPMATRFNQMVAMDLKKWSRGWILHIVDMWSRLTVSVFIERKTSKEVIDKIMKHWIGAGFGVMEGILTDNGGEFSSDEMREVASILNVKVCTTAAESPFQNGLCERIHSVTDSMLLKLQKQCPNTPLDVLLCWANMARNALQMVHGYSSYQLVFGKNPNLPNIMSDQVPALAASTTSEVFAKHLNSLHAARQSFIESESSERVRRALRCKVRASEQVFENGELVYYKREGQEKWLGPGKVVFQDGKVVFVRHGGVFVRVSPNRLIKINTKWTKNENGGLGVNKNSGDSRGAEFESRWTEYIANGEDGENTENEEIGAAAQSDDIVQGDTEQKDVTSDKIDLKAEDKIELKMNSESWIGATVLKRAGKVTGIYKNWYNLRMDNSSEIQSVDLETVEWRKIEESVNVVVIPRSRHCEEQCMEAKKIELNKLKEFNTYEEVEDTGQNRISTRWVLCEKSNNVRARLVARGFEEETSDRCDSPTVAKCTLRVFLALAVSKSWQVKTTDIKSAFLQGKTLEREVYIIPPKEAEVEEGKIWKLIHCLYGLNDAARQFYSSVVEELTRLKCIQSHLDPAMFFLKEGDRLVGMIVSHVDDFLHCGEERFEKEVMARLRERFLAGKLESGHFRYVGFDILQQKEGITLDQTGYVEEMECTTLNPQRAAQKQDLLTPAELTVLRGLVGRLNWTVQGSRPDMAFEMVELSTKFRKGTVSDLARAIKAVRKLKEETARIFFPPLGDVHCWKVVVFTDAAHANLCDGVSSMGAHLVLLVGEDKNCCVLAWHANKIKRVVRSTIAAETLSLQEGLETAIYLRRLIEEVLSLEEGSIPIAAYIDNKSVVEAVHSTKMVDDKRLRLDIAAVQQSLQRREVTSIQWCPGELQLANCMTKKGASGRQIMTLVQSGKFDF